MRLIDADALMENVQFRLPNDNKNAEIIDGCVKITRGLIENAPTIDAVPVVRCKDCKRLVILSKYGIPVCDEGPGFTPLCYDINTWFCPLGERRCDNDTP